MAHPFYNWSQTAGNNATADSTVNWQEGQAPSSVNDSARAMMASAAAYRDDIAGAIVTAGTSTAYTVSSFQVFDTLAHLSGQVIAFTPHATNGATVTLNVDGLGAKPLRSAPSIELQAGTIIQGTPYTAIYNNTDGAFYLQGFFGNPYNVPLAAGMDYWGLSTPNSSFAFATGQAISRTTYSALFALTGTTFGVGDGSTTFNLPDKRGRASVAADGGAGRISGAVFNSVVIGGVGGTESQTLTTAQIPAGLSVSVTGTFSGNSTQSGGGFVLGNNISSAVAGGAAGAIATPITFASNIPVSGTITGSGTASGGGGSHPNVQPSIVCNYIMRII